MNNIEDEKRNKIDEIIKKVKDNGCTTVEEAIKAVGYNIKPILANDPDSIRRLNICLRGNRRESKER